MITKLLVKSFGNRIDLMEFSAHIDVVAHSYAASRRALMESSYSNIHAGPPAFQLRHPHINEQAASGSPNYTILITISLVFLLATALGLHFLIKCALKCSKRMVLRRGAGRSVVVSDEGAEVVAGFGQYEYKARVAALPRMVYGSSSTDDSMKEWPWQAAGADAGGYVKDMSVCAICLTDFAEGERVRVLPECGHGFHSACVDPWISLHTSCPTCRNKCTPPAAAADAATRQPKLLL